MLPLEHEEDAVTLGEGFTPLVAVDMYGLPILCKLEFMAPTGSFKDRGTTVLVSMLKEMGVEKVVEDSSGNAAASLAAYCARAGIEARLFVPAYASPAKISQIAVYGAEVIPVEGPREKSAIAAQEAAREAYYASHKYNPFFVEGTKTFAYEVWEHLGGSAPDNVMFPVGNGSSLMGAYLGFKELQAAGLLDSLPRLFAIQARACAPLYEAYQQGLHDVVPISAGETIAEGVRIVRPARARQILRAIRSTGGAILAVTEMEIQNARASLAERGLYVEPTSAVAMAGLSKLGAAISPDELTIVALTGSGLKSP
jgi:threonine synthase